MRNKFELGTNHSRVKYLFEQPTLNPKKTIWMEFLIEYDCDINHIKGKQNKVFDALNRTIRSMHATTISMHKLYLKRRILEAISIDQHYL
jgi:hypothetical protein